MSVNGQNTPKRECTSNIESQRGAEIFYTGNILNSIKG